MPQRVAQVVQQWAVGAAVGESPRSQLVEIVVEHQKQQVALVGGVEKQGRQANVRFLGDLPCRGRLKTILGEEFFRCGTDPQEFVELVSFAQTQRGIRFHVHVRPLIFLVLSGFWKNSS
ncbi:hypothetical protein D9M71_797880 [compost metagenome]